MGTIGRTTAVALGIVCFIVVVVMVVIVIVVVVKICIIVNLDETLAM